MLLYIILVIVNQEPCMRGETGERLEIGFALELLSEEFLEITSIADWSRAMGYEAPPFFSDNFVEPSAGAPIRCCWLFGPGKSFGCSGRKPGFPIMRSRWIFVLRMRKGCISLSSVKPAMHLQPSKTFRVRYTESFWKD